MLVKRNPIVLQKLLSTFKKGNLMPETAFYSLLFQSPIDAHFIIDKETLQIFDFNQATLSLFELDDTANLKGLYFSQVILKYIKSDSANIDIIANDIPANWHGQGNFITQTDKPFDGYVSCTYFFIGKKEYQLISIRDVTLLKTPLLINNTDIEKIEDAATIKTRFLSSISHELRTPLNGIIGTTNLILEEPNLSVQAKKQLQLQLYSSEHMLSIINDILDFSKINSGKMEFNNQPFYLCDALKNITQSFENQFKQNKIQLHYNCDDSLDNLFIISDEVKLRQILNNLLSNALKFTIEGSVTLNAVIKSNTPDTVSVNFTIKDTGIGICKEKQQEIFEGFTQVHAEDLKRRFGGTGLGLTISQKLVQLFGGNINVQSELGKGATFSFIITFKKHDIPAEKESKNAKKGTSKIDIRGIKALIVEDNEINTMVLKTFLVKWGVRIMEASNGLHAVELVKYHKFDVIFMDLEMPEMNGYDATKIIRANKNPVPIIAFTATLLEDMNVLMSQKGFNDYILKPFKPAELKNKIEKFAPHRLIEYA